MMQLFFLHNGTSFVHPSGTDVFKPVYAMKIGVVGAAAFTHEMATKFIENAPDWNLKMIDLSTAVKNPLYNSTLNKN